MIFYLHNINMPAKKIYLFLNHIIKKTSICTSLFLCTIIFLQACVSTTKTTKLHFVKTSKVKSVYINGQGFFISNKNQSQVTVSFPDPYLEFNDKLYLYFNFKNLSQKPFTFKPKRHIRIIKKSDNSRVAIKSYRDLIKELDGSDQSLGAWSAVAAVALATAEAVIAAKSAPANSNFYGDENPNFYGSNNDEGRSSSFTEVTHSDQTKTVYKHNSYNSSLAHMERQSKKHQQDLERRQQQEIYDQKVRRLKKTILKKHTVMPQKEMHGQVALSLSKLELPVESFIVLVKFAGDTHKFYFKQTKD